MATFAAEQIVVENLLDASVVLFEIFRVVDDKPPERAFVFYCAKKGRVNWPEYSTVLSIETLCESADVKRAVKIPRDERKLAVGNFDVIILCSNTEVAVAVGGKGGGDEEVNNGVDVPELFRRNGEFVRLKRADGVDDEGFVGLRIFSGGIGKDGAVFFRFVAEISKISATIARVGVPRRNFAGDGSFAFLVNAIMVD